MKIETAIKIIKDRAGWYGLSNDIPRYLDLITRCGATKREIQALDTINYQHDLSVEENLERFKKGYMVLDPNTYSILADFLGVEA